jgi:hypothetical protein
MGQARATSTLTVDWTRCRANEAKQQPNTITHTKKSAAATHAQDRHSPSHPRGPAIALQSTAQRASLSPVHDVAPCDGSSQPKRHTDEHNVESHTSPMPSPSPSAWFAFSSSGQLSLRAHGTDTGQITAAEP